MAKMRERRAALSVQPAMRVIRFSRIQENRDPIGALRNCSGDPDGHSLL